MPEVEAPARFGRWLKLPILDLLLPGQPGDGTKRAAGLPLGSVYNILQMGF